MPVSVDWQAVEDAIFEQGMEEFPQIAADNPNRKIYCVFFDCDIVYTCAQAHMNTDEGLREYAESAINSSPDLYKDHTVETLMEEFRWDGGGFRMFQVFEGPEFTDLNVAYEQLYEEIEAEAERELNEPFMEACSRAVTRLDKAGAFHEFQKRCDFRILVVYIQETVEEGEARMKRIAREMDEA